MTTSATSPPDPTASTSPPLSTTKPNVDTGRIPTRLLLLSDTHILSRSKNPLPFPIPSLPAGEQADIAIHAGDITDSSTLTEFSLCLSYLRRLPAPLKLLIAGNHDFTLDLPAYSQYLHVQDSLWSNSALGTRKLLTRQKGHGLGELGAAKQLLEEARKDGIYYLEEGTHRFDLANGATLTLYASPATPAFGSQGFQYQKEKGHVFDIPEEADVVVTHGPPRGVLDVSRLTGRACGSVELWERVKEVRPRLHVFGHIHEGWGAAEKKGKGEGKGKERKERRAEMTVLVDRRDVQVGWKETREERKRKEEKVEKIVRDGYYPLEYMYPERDDAEGAEQTLFVNAAVPNAPGLVPWLVHVELPRSDDGTRQAVGSNTRSEECLSTSLG
ncbi:Metallo-dependent phosphatase-like protein [Pseudoneurospora amorphoporcata]|uniref:Metallo-dependent phosphatase-like protein n=1 Tax=Pseudoneurospora amorphoporcata TaxID=241081 RepID=A0AAN6SI34_9PEZI|nr:Metallo-dependent phosphatase-like protein [Pseudoneurospora amorphoporcata]